MLLKAPKYYGPPIKAPFTECLIMGADGVARAGSCDIPPTAQPAPVIVTAPAPTVTALPAAQPQISLTTLLLIGLGIYLITKG